MDLTFRIIWFEDIDEWYDTTSRRVKRYIESKNFKVDIQRIKKASDFSVENFQIQKYDLLVVDYELEKAQEETGIKTIYGSDIISELRKGRYVNDALFYSSHGFDIISNIMKQEGLQGVFIADRDNGEFHDIIKLLVDKAIRRTENLINIRGIVMDTTSDFDVKIKDIISVLWKTLGDKEASISNKIKRDILQDNLRTAQRLNEKYPRIDKDNIDDLLQERDFSAYRQARLLNWCIKSNEQMRDSLLTIVQRNVTPQSDVNDIDFFDLYNSQIIKYRNALAHVKNARQGEVDFYIGDVEGEKIFFNEDLCGELRKKMVHYEKALDEMYEYIEQSV